MERNAVAQKRRQPLIDFAIYLAVRLAVCLVHSLSMRLALRLAEALAWLAYQVDRRHREVAAENLRHAFPELASNSTRIDRLVRDTYRHFLTVAVEMVLLPRKMHVTTWRRYASIGASARMMSQLLLDRPALLVTAHFGNWELAGRLIGVFGLKTYAIARVLDNPYLERYVHRFRQGTGQTLIAKKDDFDRLTEALGSGAKVCTLADQDAGSRGLFVPFFGRPASTHKAVALMAIEYDSAILVFGVPRVAEPMMYVVECEDIIDPREYADRPDAIRAMTERYTAALERLIRRHPEQYFWLHRRWKSQPVKRTRLAKPDSRAA